MWCQRQTPRPRGGPANLAYQYPHSHEHFAHGDEAPIHFHHHQPSGYPTGATLGSSAIGISLPPISSLHQEHQASLTQQHQQAHPDAALPAPRTLPMPYGPPIPMMPQPEYVQPGRPPYQMQTPYSTAMTRMPLPSSHDAANLMYSAPRHGSRPKEVKRRTKTGCLTCRKRRIKVRLLPLNFKQLSGWD